MTAKFTKWPWTSSAQNGTPGHCLVAQVFSAEGQSLALIEATEDADEASDIAQMMAAAPDLYKALRMASIYRMTGADLSIVDAALAKARGESA